MSEKPTNQPPIVPGQNAKLELKSLKQKVEEQSTPEQKAERRIEGHFKKILAARVELINTVVSGASKDVIKVKDIEEANRLVDDLVIQFQNALKTHPELMEGIPKSKSFYTSFKEMLVCITDNELPLTYDVNVSIVNGEPEVNTEGSVG